MYEKATVTKVKKGICFVQITKKPHCEGCNVCAFNGNDSIILPAYTNHDCKAGDKVVVQMPQMQYTLAPLFLFAIPLFLILIGLIVGKLIGGEITMLLFGLIFAAGGFLIAYLIDIRIRTDKKYMLLIVDKILENTTEDLTNDRT